MFSTRTSAALVLPLLGVLWLATAGCGGELIDLVPLGGGGSGGGPTQPPDGLPLLGSDCDPMVPTHCGLPFPSNVYLLADPSGENPSGMSVRFGPTTLPTRIDDDEHVAPGIFFDHDGFSPASSPMTHLPLASNEGCATPFTIEASLEDDSPSVLIEADTGRLVPHWVDVDHSTDQDGLEGRPDNRLFMIRPAERLKDGTRYIAALRGVLNTDGQVIEPTPVFAALRAGERAPKPRSGPLMRGASCMPTSSRSWRRRA